MKKVFSISFLLLMLMYSTHNFWLNISFQFNRKEVALKHCENKAKPKMHCDGKCHLNKELKKENDNQSPANNAKEKFEVLFFCEVKQVLESISTAKKEHIFWYKMVHYIEPYYSIVHPPS